MAESCVICLLGAMDRLWFHQIILLSEPNTTSSLLFSKTLKTVPEPMSESSSSLAYLSSNDFSQTTLLEEETSPPPSVITSSEDEYCSNQQEDDKKETKLKESKTWSQSSSLLNQMRPKRLRSYSGAVMRLQKTMSCKTLLELELEEVKGFMDLGFEFSKDHLSPRMMSVVPGLQRLGLKNGTKDGEQVDDDHEVIEQEEEEGREVTRPYLSEAWLIKRPDSPLLNLRLPRVSAAAEMKKHLRYWARTVASVIQQES